MPNDNKTTINAILDELGELEILTRGFENPEALRLLAIKKTQKIQHLYETLILGQGLKGEGCTAERDTKDQTAKQPSATHPAPQTEEDAHKEPESPHLPHREQKEETAQEKAPVTNPASSPVHDSLARENTVVTKNDKFKIQSPGEKKVATSRIESRFVKSIKGALNINDSIRYRNELFYSNADLMKQTIADLDTMQSLDEAIAYIKSRFAWPVDNTAASDFMELLEKRFS